MSPSSVFVLLPGPIASMLSNKFGFRPVIICGGLMMSLGLGLSYFAQSLYYLYFSFGVLTGNVSPLNS